MVSLALDSKRDAVGHSAVSILRRHFDFVLAWCERRQWERELRRALDGRVSLDYPPEGVVCTI